MRQYDKTFDVRYSSSPRIHIHNLVTACRKRSDRLMQLAVIVQSFEGDTDAVARLKAAAEYLIMNSGNSHS
jgi:hypothetical protein